MYYQKKPNGSYQFFESYKDPRTGKHKTVSVTMPDCKRATQRLASDTLRERVASLIMGPAKSSPKTFKAVCEAYVAAQKREFKEQTASNNEKKLNALQRLIGPETDVTELSAPYVRRCFECDNPTTYNERIKRFKALIRWAYREEIVTDIAYLDKLPRRKVQTARERNAEKYLEHDELIKLLDGMASDEWKLLTRFLALSGLRIGEAIALNSDDIDIITREITVDKTFSQEIQKITTAKTETSARLVYMQDELFACVMQIMSRKDWIVRKFKIRTPIFFPTVDGERIHYDAYRKYFRENCERLIGRPLTPHALRHTHVALLAEAGVGLDTISRRLGHAGSAVTRDIYFHVTDKMREKENEVLREIRMI